MQVRHPQPQPANRAARRAAKRGKAAPHPPSSQVPLRDGRASTKPVHTRVDYAARRSG